jgi:hypothetical protein
MVPNTPKWMSESGVMKTPILCCTGRHKNAPYETLSPYLYYIYIHTHIHNSRDSAVGIANGYGLDDRGVGVRVPVGSRIFTFACNPYRLFMQDIKLVGVNPVKTVDTVGENLFSIYRGTESQILRASFMLLVTFLAYSKALKADVVGSTGSLANIYWTTRITFLTSNLHCHLHETLK